MATTLIALADVTSAFAGVTTAQAAGLPASATAAVERYCCRRLALAAYDEEYSPGTTRILGLKAWPVIAVDRISSDLSSALSVSATGTPWRASVAIVTDGDPRTPRPTGLKLTTVSGGASAVVSLPFAPTSGPALLTVAALAAAVASTAGWTAIVGGGMGDCPTSELRPVAGALDALGRSAGLQAYSSQLSDWELAPRTGRITLRQGRPDGYSYPARTSGLAGLGSLVRVVYTAGYNGDPAAGPVTTPPDLAEACILTARAILDCRDISAVLKSEDLGNTSYVVGEALPVPSGARQLLIPYCDRRF